METLVSVKYKWIMFKYKVLTERKTLDTHPDRENARPLIMFGNRPKFVEISNSKQMI